MSCFLEWTNNNIEFLKLILDVIGLSFVFFGLILPYRHSRKMEALRSKNEKELEQIRWKKNLIDRQIANLYGPIYALIEENEHQDTLVREHLNRNEPFSGKYREFENWPENEKQIWIHYVDTYKIKNQLEIVKILRNNMHLIYQSQTPVCITEFLGYALEWDLLSKQNKSGIPNFYEYHARRNYPDSFRRYIRSTYQELLNEQIILLDESGKKASAVLRM